MGAFLALAPLPSSPGPEATFSHREHLALPNVACATCHIAVAASTSSADDNRPSGEACLRCHDKSYAESARSRPAAKRTYRFEHKAHLALGDFAPVFAGVIEMGTYLGDAAAVRSHLDTGDPCLACHRGMREADVVTAAHLPRMADCLVCHTTIDPPFSCSFCHTPDAELRPPSHTAQFADQHSSRKVVPDKSGCKLCHGTKFTCMGCH